MKFENRDIIVFGDDWGRYPSTIQHIARVFAVNNRIIWVGSLGQRKPHLSVRDVKRIWEKIKSLLRKKKLQTDQNDRLPVFPVYPFLIPIHNLKILRLINAFSVANAIRKKSEELEFKCPVILTASPVSAEIIKRLDYSSVHYLCMDDFASFKDAYKCIARLEKELLEIVDSTFSISDDLVVNRKPKSGHSFFIPQGVDTNHFTSDNNTVDESREVTIGFFGLLADWIDLDLIARAARQYPEYRFLIIGKSERDLSVFSGINNLQYIREIPYKELPTIAGHFTVGLIPFKINELTIASNPLKLKEYMSLGVPIVATDLPEVRKFGDLVFVARNDDEFISCIKKAIEDNIPERNALRRAEAEQYSWTSIAESMGVQMMYVEGLK